MTLGNSRKKSIAVISAIVLLLVALGNSDADLTVNGKHYTPSGSSAIGLKITPKGGAAPLTPSPTCSA